MPADLATSLGLNDYPARRITIAVCGSVAAVNVPQLVTLFRHVAGVEVRLLLTRAATTFVTARALSVLSGHPAHVDGDDANGDALVRHLEITRGADALLVCPATAHVLGRAAQGLADDLVTTTILAASCPVVFAPCMNDVMWNKPAVRRNVETLRADGAGIIPPTDGIASSDGKVGPGAMPDPIALAQAVATFLRARRAPAESGRVETVPS
jgi:phosphopantothenoylcysteine synthetase/decarboxylase